VSTFRNGQRVVYRPHVGAEPDHGVITEAYATARYHRVRYGADVLSKLTPHECLYDDDSAEEIVMRAALAGLGAAREVTALLDGLIGETRPAEDSVFVWDVAIAHRATIAAATLALDDAIRETMPLLTWAQTGEAVHRD
jgi:hypothetical protein